MHQTGTYLVQLNPPAVKNLSIQKELRANMERKKMKLVVGPSSNKTDQHKQDKANEETHQRLRRSTLESTGFRISKRKTEYMHFMFSQHEKSEVEVRLVGIAVPKCNQFRFLGSLFQENRMINEDVIPRIKTGWLKWRSATWVLCDRSLPTKVKDKIYRIPTRLAMLYGSE